MPNQRAKLALSEVQSELTMLRLAWEALNDDLLLGIDQAPDQALARIQRSLTIVEQRAERANSLIATLRAEKSR